LSFIDDSSEIGQERKDTIRRKPAGFLPIPSFPLVGCREVDVDGFFPSFSRRGAGKAGGVVRKR